MFSSLNRLLRRFFRQSRTINNEPLNKVSLIVIILIDVFILINVFIGLNDISSWYLSPSATYPCYAEWNAYRNQNTETKDFDIIRKAAETNPFSWQEQYQQAAIDRLGEVNNLCLQYANDKDKIQNPDNASILEQLIQNQDAINTLESTNQTIREQYDSTLLEELADQPRDQSINLVDAARAKATLAQNNAEINNLKAESAEMKDALVSKPESVAFLKLLQQESTFNSVEQGYDNAVFWYPSIQLIFQGVFLAPLILVALTGYILAQKHGYGLIALISWHLLIIFFIPLAIKVFEFLQVGILFNFIFNIVSTLFGQLLFLVSYIYILLIPALGFAGIKFFQRFVFNPKLQAASRVQKSRCINCAKKLNPLESHCPHCGYYQYRECQHCHELTYKYLPYCKHCGTAQETSF